MADEGFDREMADADWDAVYERQAARGALVDDYADRLALGPGDTVLELGCGPGHATGRLAARVTPGTVLALDRRLGALQFLRREAADHAGAVSPVLGDLTSLPVRFKEPTPTLVAFVLHHVAAPHRAIESVATALPAGSPLLVVEYRPDAPGAVGPAVKHRLAPTAVARWLVDAGFETEPPADLPEEKYALRAVR